MQQDTNAPDAGENTTPKAESSRPIRPESGSAVARLLDREAGREPGRWTALLVGIFLIFAAIVAEHVTEGHRAPHAATAAATPPGGDHSTTPAQAQPEQLIVTLPMLIRFVGELGFAFVIAWIVSRFVEARAARQHLASLEDARHQIEADVRAYLTDIEKVRDMMARGVVEGVFGIKHDPEYVRTVVSSGLDSRIVRENYDLSFRLERFSEAEVKKYGVDPHRHVKLIATTRYRIRNLGNVTETVKTRYGLPLRRGFEDVVQLNALEIGADKFTADRISRLAKHDVERNERDYPIEVRLDPLDSVWVFTEATLIKDFSDSETFGFIYPTTRLTIRFNNSIEGLELGASARTATPMRQVHASPDGRAAEWKIDGSILPMNSVLVWWREAVAQDSAPVLEPSGSQAIDDPAVSSSEVNQGSPSLGRKSTLP